MLKKRLSRYQLEWVYSINGLNGFGITCLTYEMENWIFASPNSTVKHGANELFDHHKMFLNTKCSLSQTFNQRTIKGNLFYSKSQIFSRKKFLNEVSLEIDFQLYQIMRVQPEIQISNGLYQRCLCKFPKAQLLHSKETGIAKKNSLAETD